MQRRDHQHVRVPLDHHVRVVGEPDRAVLRRLAVAVLRAPPRASCGRPASPACASALLHADGLHRVVLAELPAQVVAGDELPEPRVERADVVVLEVDLDEGLPVVVALVQLHVVEHVAGEVEVGARAAAAPVVGAPRRSRCASNSRPFQRLQRVVAQVQARVVGEVRRADQRARAGRRSSGAAGRRCCAAGVAAPAQHHRLAVPADVGDQLHAVARAHQRAALALLRQGVGGRRRSGTASSWPT